ncbi:MAG: hypothetical protein LBI03_11845 [Clostridiales bacterium]|jgi:hypothetical protein|nr:hypothetical protein [Clostridiales bacterium]
MKRKIVMVLLVGVIGIFSIIQSGGKRGDVILEDPAASACPEETVSASGSNNTSTPSPSNTLSPSGSPGITPTQISESTTPVETVTPKPTIPVTAPAITNPVITPTTPSSVTPKPDTGNNQTPTYSMLTIGTDALGRSVSANGSDTSIPSAKTNRYVGIFYFLWLGEHGTDLFDNSKIVASNPNAIQSEANWIASGGGRQQQFHFWGQPLFGYYKSNDEWVMRKHVQLLTDAGIDFMVFDTTNGYPYTSNALKMLKVLDEYGKKGYNVPKIAFYTNSNSGSTMQQIYQSIYKAHPEYSGLWFNWDGKPMIIGNASDPNTSSEVKSFFRIKATQWPNEDRKADGFPWMEFSRSLTNNAIYGLNGRKEVMNVSVAQHYPDINFSQTAWYGGNARTRSYHNGSVDKSANAVQYGYNFAEQFDFAISKDPEIIFITGWNEWVAQRQSPEPGDTIRFVDNADINTSRDIEPMQGGYGDNYYMEMVQYIRKYKGSASIPVNTENTTIDISGSSSQWNNVKIGYKDYTNDIVNRNASGWGSLQYSNSTGRNDINEMKVASDSNYVYFFVNAINDITAPSGSNWMNLYISSGKSGNKWNGYDFVLNRIAPTNGKATLEKCASNGSYSWTGVASVNCKIEGNCMMVAIPRSALGIAVGVFTIQFKWTDNCNPGDIFSFYSDGDAAPIGRLNYGYKSNS